MAVFSAGMIQAELRGKSFLCRTAASFVSTRIGIIPKAPILPKDLGINKERKGGLIVVGSLKNLNYNVVRKAYMNSLSNPKQDLVHVMASAKEAMKAVVAEKMRLFGSSGKA
ncbi:hypothetical protein OIU77_008095 [Salix suchowensis]|uniref:Uncharacterized protein n=1 Tax=Salix suchowensis TaxID=1278906 RepID=A0ABQ9AIB8_9ROSI|nr:hypothetical protein OIU77_008095 [Salix suchowensis]